PSLRSCRCASCAASAALFTQEKTPRAPPPEPPQPQSFLAGAEAAAGGETGAAEPPATRETTDSTMDRMASGSRVFMKFCQASRGAGVPLTLRKDVGGTPTLLEKIQPFL